MRQIVVLRIDLPDAENVFVGSIFACPAPYRYPQISLIELEHSGGYE